MISLSSLCQFSMTIEEMALDTKKQLCSHNSVGEESSKFVSVLESGLFKKKKKNQQKRIHLCS